MRIFVIILSFILFSVCLIFDFLVRYNFTDFYDDNIILNVSFIDIYKQLNKSLQFNFNKIN